MHGSPRREKVAAQFAMGFAKEECGRVRRSRDRAHFLVSNQKNEGLYAKLGDCGCDKINQGA